MPVKKRKAAPKRRVAVKRKPVAKKVRRSRAKAKKK